MVLGEFRNKLVDGNRLVFPKKFREEMGTKLVITQSYEGCLLVVSPNQWGKLVVASASGPFVAGSVRETSRFLLGGAEEVELDEQGRFVVGEALREYGAIRKEVTFLGLGRWVEIWESERWKEHKAYLLEHKEEIAETLSRTVFQSGGA